MPEVSGMEKQMADLNEKYRVELKQMQDEYQKKIFRLRSTARFIDRKYQVEKNARDSRYPRTYG